MKVFLWNSRGAGGPSFIAAMKEFRKKHNPEIMVIAETRTSEANAMRQLRKLRLHDRCICIHPEGRAGGIWLCWTDKVQISEPLFISKQEHEWLLSGVYASPQYLRRRLLWEEFQNIAGEWSGPWMAVGDFNSITTSSEKCGGSRTFPSLASNEFKETIAQCNFLDLGFSGSNFTWTNSQFGGGYIAERLDRALANGDWRVKFSDATVNHLARAKSDHNPLLISTAPDPGPRRLPFRFHEFFLRHHLL